MAKVVQYLKKTTGLTGLAVSKNPRETLISVYNKTLDVLSTMPSTAVYRTSTENLTKQRIKLVEMEGNIEELEKKIGCGQIEEVIEQANDELSLAEKMREWQPWEPLQTEPPPDQWKWPIGKST
ncbi:NADH dehydrogenase [ubiquinone] 1 alpha subcomplex subunit 5-like [Dendronephthya gigantea]|uniref:NADH dehydrogenase [ubiquinone] 1 alpha subcomplex subunit 5-like n=1 Tax=Dendronephthya gigantea TaxID=151771 RepID=UPI00106D0BBF|nr:NADH dehydrogenase [ubiquinone] 1 alpha subcomplex subunit 5-like [Dendronephthya gigantea]